MELSGSSYGFFGRGLVYFWVLEFWSYLASKDLGSFFT